MSMTGRAGYNFCRTAATWVFSTAVVVSTGCAGPQQGGQQAQKSSAAKSAEPEPTPAEVAQLLEPNVLGVACFYNGLNPWMWNSDHTQVCGVKGGLYLLGPKSTGVFGEGAIKPRLFVSTRDENGKLMYQLVKEWSFDVNQAMPLRGKRRTNWGWGYELFLQWGKDLNLSGRDIRLTVSFERTDGVVISGSKKDFRVPKPDNR